mmetsp:Transcript_11659/g.30921  ORF Transcript_11659/g.30921 Transcript_11659/m.30921 type:complete len:82 (+) Transcript_11659:296-541(+)
MLVVDACVDTSEFSEFELIVVLHARSSSIGSARARSSEGSWTFFSIEGDEGVVEPAYIGPAWGAAKKTEPVALPRPVLKFA